MEMQKVTVLFLEDFPGENVPRFEAWREASIFGRDSKDVLLDYGLVASVFIEYDPSKSDSHYLEKAFDLTQNDYDNWTENVNVTSHVEGSTRSSSVGDRFIINGVIYIVSVMGFEKV